MSVKKEAKHRHEGLNTISQEEECSDQSPSKTEIDGMESCNPQEEIVSYNNNKITTAIGWVIWLVIVAANVYAVVELGINT